ncbi:hypothetical protein ABE26_07435 [Cytobacillus firmus]|nr:hypothetical protein [Cytobacillus firmus]
MSIGKQISELRKKHKLTQQELAKRIGISRAALSHYEKDRREPDSDTIIKLASFFDVSTDAIYGFTQSNEYIKSTDGTMRVREKEERDIAKRMEEFRKDLTDSDGLSFMGEPLSEEAKESLTEAIEHIFRQTQRLNKKYIPKKHRNDEDQ